MASIHGWKNDGERSGKNVGGNFLTLKQENLDSTGFDYFTLFMVFSADPGRIRGEYHFKNMIARLDDDPGSDNGGYKLEVCFTNLSDCKELYDLIRSGKIWPLICYEDDQVPAPCRHLKDLFREAFGIIRREFARKLHFA